MRYEWIHSQKEAFSVSVMCHVLQVSRSGYYAYVECLQNPRPNKNAILIESVKRIHQEMNASMAVDACQSNCKRKGIMWGVTEQER